MGNIEGLNIAGSLRRTWRNAGAPVDGVAGTYAGIAEKGDLLIDSTNANLYQNTGTQASPVWTQISAGGVTYGLVGEMAAAGTGTGNTVGIVAKASRVDHVHALGAHDHSDATKGSAIVLAAIGAGMFTADAAGRGKFADGFVDTTRAVAGLLAASAAGRALVATNFFDAATAADKFADSSIPGAKVNFSFGVTPTAIVPDATGAEGTSGSVARADHTHAIVAATPSATNSLAAAAAEGASTSFLRADAVFLARLANNVFFTGRNFADAANTNAWKINTADYFEFGTPVELGTLYIQQGTNPAASGVVRVPNNVVLGAGRNAANGADISMFKVNASDNIAAGAGIDLATFFVRQGTNPATAGIVRAPNNVVILAGRNAANGADVNVVKINASDLIEFGASLAAFTLGGVITATGQAVSWGAIPASAGNLRFANDAAIGAARNAANAADINLWKVNASDDYEAAADVNMAGNTIFGNTTAAGVLVLSSTINATKGYVRMADGELALQIGGAAARATPGTDSISLFNGVAPAGALVNGVSLYSSGGEFYAMDAAGNATLNSPHTPDGDFIIHSFSVVKGKTVRIHLEKLIRLLAVTLPPAAIAGLIEEHVGMRYNHEIH